MTLDPTQIGRRLREVRERAEISQSTAGAAIGHSQPTYARIEAGERLLKGHELIQLADCFGVRVSTITRVPAVTERARFAARTNGGPSSMAAMRDRLYAYLELDAYLTDQGFPAGVN